MNDCLSICLKAYLCTTILAVFRPSSNYSCSLSSMVKGHTHAVTRVLHKTTAKPAERNSPPMWCHVPRQFEGNIFTHVTARLQCQCQWFEWFKLPAATCRSARPRDGGNCAGGCADTASVLSVTPAESALALLAMQHWFIDSATRSASLSASGTGSLAKAQTRRLSHLTRLRLPHLTPKNETWEARWAALPRAVLVRGDNLPMECLWEMSVDSDAVQLLRRKERYANAPPAPPGGRLAGMPTSWTLSLGLPTWP